MSNDTDGRLQEIFRSVFQGATGDVTQIRQVTEPSWDSLAHVTLVAALESEFNITVDAARSLELTSYAAVRLFLSEVLA
jgi:acyl carrier protein